MEQVHEARAPGLLGRLQTARDFLDGVQHELKKVTWPTRPELVKATRMVVVMALILGIAIGLTDWLLNLILVRGVAAIAR
jgi:preprotein translocase SecE subunit